MAEFAGSGNPTIAFPCKCNPNVTVTLEFTGTVEQSAMEEEFARVFLEKAQREFMKSECRQNKFVQDQNPPPVFSAVKAGGGRSRE